MNPRQQMPMMPGQIQPVQSLTLEQQIALEADGNNALQRRLQTIREMAIERQRMQQNLMLELQRLELQRAKAQ